jgi:uncharacterized protein
MDRPLEGQPFDLFVIKVASRCNLACGYCYEYFHGDESWRAQPKAMARDVLRKAAERIAFHASEHRLPRVSISLHGGEPFTVGLAALDDYVSVLKEVIEPICYVDIGMQTNGTLYDDEAHAWALARHVGIGVSLDGPPQVNDARRPFHNGRGSTASVEAALGRLSGSRVFNGILAVIDIASDPVTTLRYLGQWCPPTLDFLLPHGHWGKPPVGRTADIAGDPAYGRWLAAAFDEWWATPLAAIGVRTFEDIILRLFGRPGSSETLGTEPITLLTIGTNGAYEGVDTLKSAFPGAQVLGMHSATHSLDDVLRHRAVAARQAGVAALSATCQSCALVSVCGGGYLPHRLGPDGTFEHPSVYCSDLTFLIQRIRARLLERAVVSR